MWESRLMGKGPDNCAVTSVHCAGVGPVPLTTIGRRLREGRGRRKAHPPYSTRTLVLEVGTQLTHGRQHVWQIHTGSGPT